MNYKKQIVDDFRRLQGKHNMYELWCDFLEMAAISIANSVNKIGWNEREQKYLQTSKRYTKEELISFSEILGKITLALEEDYTDLLGEIFMELELYSASQGQFFTPYNLSQLCASISFNEERVKQEIETKGYIKMNEPSVGGGGMCVAMIEKMLSHGYNPQKQLYIECNDLDIKGVYMTYITLSLYGIPAKVHHMNTLTLEHFSEWHTPSYVMNYIKFRNVG